MYNFYDKKLKQATECTQLEFLQRHELIKSSWERSAHDVKHNNRLNTLMATACLGLTDPTDLLVIRTLIMDPSVGCIATRNNRDADIFLIMNIPFYIESPYYYGNSSDKGSFVLKGKKKQNPTQERMITFLQVYGLNYYAADPKDHTKYFKVKTFIFISIAS
jgi:hypothetical protein